MSSAEKALALTPDDPVVMFRVALVYNQFGDKSKTLVWLQKAAKAGFPRPNIRDTPDFDELRSNPKFQRITSSK